MSQDIDNDFNRMLKEDPTKKLSAEDSELLVSWVMFTFVLGSTGERMAGLNRRLLSRNIPILLVEDTADVEAIGRAVAESQKQLDKALELLRRK